MPPKRVGRDGRTHYAPSGGSRRGLNTRFSRTPGISASALRASEQSSAAARFEAIEIGNKIDSSMGFDRFEGGKRRIGWLCNMHSTVVEDATTPGGRAGVDFYFIAGEADNGPGADTFKATVLYDPYFLIAVRAGREQEVEEWVRRSFEGLVKTVKRVEKEDLSLPNHLIGIKRRLLQLVFSNVTDLLAVRKVLLPIAEKNRAKMDELDTYSEYIRAEAAARGGAGWDDDDEADLQAAQSAKAAISDPSGFVIDVREYDVPYHVRLAIDLNIRVGKWYSVEAEHGSAKLTCLEDRLTRPDPVVMAYDIETTKLPLKFPDAAIDQIMMISYMIDGCGFLLTNREIVSKNIDDFEYTPKPEFPGPFMIFNEPDERAVLEKFFEHIQTVRPNVMVTYNGDFFDWPFVEARAAVHGMDMYAEIGFRKNSEDVYQSDYCSHLDAFAWVNRDSYLPQGSRGLKAVTVAKLGYDPDELDPELMTPYASERPQTLAEYSVSDAVATYYLYMKYVHPFIFSLCTILPLAPDDVLRKGTGTLCEMLLMVQAYERNILLPNKHTAPREAFWDGHLLESETYVGGHVESIEAGVFRSDIEYAFNIEPEAVDELLDALDSALKFSITVEERKKMEDVENYEEVKEQIAGVLRSLKVNPNRMEKPLIYHLDVASMYPNIMTTNRLQPDSMISERNCASCEFNHPNKTCDRRLPWSWRGEFLPAKKDEYNMVRRQLEAETINGKLFTALHPDEQAKLVKKRLQDYSKRIYHKIHDARVIEREAIICQRENPFYVNTVKTFRDRRYDFKGKQKEWKNKMGSLAKAGAPAAEVDEAGKMVVLYDSLQLAHKVILNSFYGYVMRKGSRWYSLEMAGVTCLTGARIIQMARQLVERIGRPLELDTDGIWCILPGSFPENFAFRMKGGRKLGISYPCVMLNHLVHDRFTNHQYEELVDDAVPGVYNKHPENSIFFEVDGPYRAMILPTSKEEGKNLKKRYAVFNPDGSLAELKGFEVKRRGELKLIKIFQTQLFKHFLKGNNLAECYQAVGRIADRWLDVLEQKGETLSDDELMELIAENKSLAKTVEEYGAQKSTALTTARRLADFLGAQMVKDKGLNCRFIISAAPKGAPVTDRAVPVAIFATDEEQKRHFLRRWLRGDPRSMDPRDIIDWDYYKERLASVIQKLITIPAALQKVRNPVPRVAHPDWLDRKIRGEGMRQLTLGFKPVEKSSTQSGMRIQTTEAMADLEDFGHNSGTSSGPSSARGTATKLLGKRKAATPAVTPVDPFAALPPVMPDIDRDYPAWLSYQKQKWAIQRASRERRRQLFGDRPRIDPTDRLGGLFRRQAEAVGTKPWDVIEFRESPNVPGEVRAWVWLDGRVQNLSVIVKRRVYVHVRDRLPTIDIAECSVERMIGWRLPSGEKSDNLYQFEMTEAVYRKSRARLRRLVSEGARVFETGVPLGVRAVLELGNKCAVDKSRRGVLGEGMDKGFQLEWLNPISAGSGPGSKPKAPSYLSSPGLGIVFVWHVLAGEREVWAVFSATAGSIVISAPGHVDTPNGSRVYSDLRAQLDGGNGTWVRCPEHMTVAVSHFSNSRRAISAASDALKKAVASSNAVVVLQSPNPKRVTSAMLALRDLAVINVPANAADSVFPALSWAPVALKRSVRAFLGANDAVGQMVQLARFGGVPVGNMADPKLVIDVNYGRKLTESRILLWWSNGLGDLGGEELDDVVATVEQIPPPEMNLAGSHQTVCVDLKVRNLAVGTLLASSLENDDASGLASALADGFDNDAAFSSAAITAFKDTVRGWWTAACADPNDEETAAAADMLVQHLANWACSPNSKLFDYRISRVVKSLSRSALQQLLADFRRVGASVVYASESRVVLDTGKKRVENAMAFVQYVLKAVADKPIFRFVVVEIREWWDILAWLDDGNYGGVVWNPETDGRGQVTHWQIAAVLPPAVQPVFRDWASKFLHVLFDRKVEMTKNGAGIPGNERATTVEEEIVTFQSLTTLPDEATLPKSFSKNLTHAVSNLVKRQSIEMLHPDLADDWAVPKLPGLSLGPSSSSSSSSGSRFHAAGAVKESPTLMLVKSLMQIVSLDRSLAISARILRKNLLSLCHVREFADEARWHNLVPKCVAHVRCGECGMGAEIDLCRGPEALAFLASGGGGDGVSGAENNNTNNSGGSNFVSAAAATATAAWKCHDCDTPYPALVIEEHLIGQVVRVPIEWAVQDVRCAKCGRSRPNEFAEFCVCAGEWVNDADGAGAGAGAAASQRAKRSGGADGSGGGKGKEDISRRLRVWEDVGRWYGFEMLLDVVEQVRSGL